MKTNHHDWCTKSLNNLLFDSRSDSSRSISKCRDKLTRQVAHFAGDDRQWQHQQQRRNPLMQCAVAPSQTASRLPPEADRRQRHGEQHGRQRANRKQQGIDPLRHLLQRLRPAMDGAQARCMPRP